MTGLPIAALLAQLRPRLPDDVTKLVASFLPTGFDLLPPMRPNRRSLAQQCAFLHEFFTSVEETEYVGLSDDVYLEMLEDTTIAVMQLVGVRGPTARATMLSIFVPPVTCDLYLARADRLVAMGLRRLQRHIDGHDGLVTDVSIAELNADMDYLRELFS
jgi:hypothetical protein